MQGRDIALAVAVWVTGVSAGAMAQIPDMPLGDDFVFRRPLPLDLPQRAYSWPYTPPTNTYGPPSKPEPEPVRRSAETRATQLPCTSRPDRPIPDGGFIA